MSRRHDCVDYEVESVSILSQGDVMDIATLKCCDFCKVSFSKSLQSVWSRHQTAERNSSPRILFHTFTSRPKLTEVLFICFVGLQNTSEVPQREHIPLRASAVKTKGGQELKHKKKKKKHNMSSSNIYCSLQGRSVRALEGTVACNPRCNHTNLFPRSLSTCPK